MLNSCFQDESLNRKRLSRISSKLGFQTASVTIQINTRYGYPPHRFRMQLRHIEIQYYIVSN